MKKIATTRYLVISIISLVVYMISFMAVSNDRGYFAIGGEFAFFILSAVTALIFCFRMLDKRDAERKAQELADAEEEAAKLEKHRKYREEIDRLMAEKEEKEHDDALSKAIEKPILKAKPNAKKVRKPSTPAKTRNRKREIQDNRHANRCVLCGRFAKRSQAYCQSCIDKLADEIKEIAN